MNKIGAIILLVMVSLSTSAQIEIQSSYLFLPFGLHLDIYSEAFLLKGRTGVKQEVGWHISIGNLAIDKDRFKIYKIHFGAGLFGKSSSIYPYLYKHNYARENDGKSVMINDNYFDRDSYWLGYSKLTKFRKKPYSDRKFGIGQFFGYGINASLVNSGTVNFFVADEKTVDKFILEPKHSLIAEFGLLGTTQVRSLGKWVNFSIDLNYGCYFLTPQVYTITHRQVKSNAPSARSHTFVAMPKLRFEIGITVNNIVTIVQKKRIDDDK